MYPEKVIVEQVRSAAAFTHCAVVLIFLGLGNLGLTDREEGSNAEAAREMFESDNLVTPTLNGKPLFSKPVFVYWLIMASYRLFGVNEFSARFPSALFGVALILFQYLFLTYVRGSVMGLPFQCHRRTWRHRVFLCARLTSRVSLGLDFFHMLCIML